MQHGVLPEVGTVPSAQTDGLPHWKELARLPEAELGQLDPALVQFAANRGLPGSERLDPHGCLRAVGDWAGRVAAYTERNLPQFRREPASFDHSEAYFRALCLATVLQAELGVRYDPAKVARDVPFGVEDTTIHGIVFGGGGTCASLPVLYAAVGRRLGYPIKLATVFVDEEVLHLIARWDGGGARFNIEATTDNGLGTPPDDHYRTGRYKGTPLLERQGRFLESKSPRMELAAFLQERARACRRLGWRAWAAEALAWALALDPANVVSEDYLRILLNEWTRQTEGRMPPGFPSVEVGHPRGRRFFPDELPWHYEHQILGLMSVERLLDEPDLARVWERMRRGEWRGRGPNRAVVDFRPNGSSEASVELKP